MEKSGDYSLSQNVHIIGNRTNQIVGFLIQCGFTIFTTQKYTIKSSHEGISGKPN